jgi:hypothetical protein
MIKFLPIADAEARLPFLGGAKLVPDWSGPNGVIEVI